MQSARMFSTIIIIANAVKSASTAAIANAASTAAIANAASTSTAVANAAHTIY